MLEKFANADLWIIYFILFVVVLAISWTLSFVFNKARAVKDSAKAGKRRAMGFLSGLVTLLFVVIVLLLLAVARIYAAFTAHQHIATVECRRANSFGRDAFELSFRPIVKGTLQEEQLFILKGEKWSAGGDILEWHNYLTLLGLKSMYRLTRVQGNYIHAEDEMTKGMTVFPLVEEEQSEFWKTLSDIAVKTPLIKSAHQNFVSTYPYYGDTFHIYATPSGFTLERREDAN